MTGSTAHPPEPALTVTHPYHQKHFPFVPLQSPAEAIIRNIRENRVLPPLCSNILHIRWLLYHFPFVLSRPNKTYFCQSLFAHHGFYLVVLAGHFQMPISWKRSHRFHFKPYCCSIERKNNCMSSNDTHACTP